MPVHPLQRFRSLPDWLRWTLAALAGILLTLFIFLIFPAGPGSHPAGALVRIIEIKPAQVRLDAFLERNLISDSEPDELSLSVSNNSDQPLEGLHLAVDAPGFSVDQKKLTCTGAAGTPGSNALASHQSCSFQVKLDPLARSGAYGTTAFLHWSQANAGQHATVLLAPITIERRWGAVQWIRSFRRLGSFLKDITLPVILLYLGYFFTGKQKTRDNEQANREKEREARQEVEKLLLTRVMELAKAHYLAFVGIARSILSEADKLYGNKTGADEKKLFLQVLLLLKRMENFRNAEGGVFFRRRGGERAVSAAWYLLKARMVSAFGEEDTAKVLEQVEVDWDYAKFTAKFRRLDYVWQKFHAWVQEPMNSSKPSGSFRQLLCVLDAFQAVTAVEADYAFKYWYDEKDLGKPNFQLPGPTVLYRSYAAVALEIDKIGQLAEELQGLYDRKVEVREMPKP